MKSQHRMAEKRWDFIPAYEASRRPA